MSRILQQRNVNWGGFIDLRWRCCAVSLRQLKQMARSSCCGVPTRGSVQIFLETSVIGKQMGYKYFFVRRYSANFKPMDRLFRISQDANTFYICLSEGKSGFCVALVSQLQIYVVNLFVSEYLFQRIWKGDLRGADSPAWSTTAAGRLA